MIRRVQLLRLALQDVGSLQGRFDLGPFGGGLSVVSGQSQGARSALAAALRAALFERHDERSAAILALQAPGARHAPEVRIEVSVGGERIRVHKRFLETPLAEVRLNDEGAVFTGAAAEDVLRARVGSFAPGPPGSGQIPEDFLAAALALTTAHGELSEQLAEIEGKLPALEGEWKAAVDAEAQARDAASLAAASEMALANAEAQFDRLHREVAVRASLVREIQEAPALAVLEAAARQAAAKDSLARLRAITPDALLHDRRALALAALPAVHRRARVAAMALDTATPELLRGETVRALGAITSCKRRSREVRDMVVALTRAWRFPLILEDATDPADDGRLPSKVQRLREAASELQIIVLTEHPARFSRARVDHTVDLDRLREEPRPAPEWFSA